MAKANKKFFKEAANKQRQRILERMDNVEPGSKEYRELEAQLGAWDVMEDKRSTGSIKPIDILKFSGTLVVTGVTLTADAWLPTALSKIKIGEFAKRLF